MAFDEKLNQARATYAAKLADKLTRLEDLIRGARRAGGDTVAQAQRLAHAICGGAGTFGIDTVAEATGAIDRQLVERLAGRVEADAGFWDRIEAALERARAGLH